MSGYYPANSIGCSVNTVSVPDPLIHKGNNLNTLKAGDFLFCAHQVHRHSINGTSSTSFGASLWLKHDSEFLNTLFTFHHITSARFHRMITAFILKSENSSRPIYVIRRRSIDHHHMITLIAGLCLECLISCDAFWGRTAYSEVKQDSLTSDGCQTAPKVLYHWAPITEKGWHIYDYAFIFTAMNFAVMKFSFICYTSQLMNWNHWLSCALVRQIHKSR